MAATELSCNSPHVAYHQDDAAQEDRWRTVMKRETMKRFQKQGEAINKQREASDKQREAIA